MLQFRFKFFEKFVKSQIPLSFTNWSWLVLVSFEKNESNEYARKLALQTTFCREESIQPSLQFPSFLPFQSLGHILRLLRLQRGEWHWNTLCSGSSRLPSLSMPNLFKVNIGYRDLTERHTPSAKAWALRSAISLRSSSERVKSLTTITIAFVREKVIQTRWCLQSFDEIFQHSVESCVMWYVYI